MIPHDDVDFQRCQCQSSEKVKFTMTPWWDVDDVLMIRVKNCLLGGKL
jgi:hypothetical protein